ncbi:hypothetical protein BB559_000109 [Furculomyces boomerangus]|uniref:Nucleotide exchange factor Fes1 domain-containing protein n=2 Tax=Harpellales TaxID=61421 RepID=A0A2T9Z692_9FUNG|nr:hypothetical protein BB559_004705 [Furculomyces boomerangus]PVV00114.1 hypothetical protein BB559_000109 [Furculomyces boomerangus]PWA00563.1 hypothetical protein BB558_003371 [Smittium angustum]
MDKLLQWAIINSQTEKEDAPKSERSIDVEKIDPEIIDAILGKPVSVQMQECMDAIENLDYSVEDREVEFDNLEMLIEQIDNAGNLEPLGLWPRIIAQLESTETEMRLGALWVIGTAVQHNPKAQAAFSSHSGLENVLNTFKTDPKASVKTKAVYAISSYVRNNLVGFSELVKLNGIEMLVDGIGSFPEVSKKIVFLFSALVYESLDEIAGSDLRPPPSFPLAMIEKKIAYKLLDVIEMNLNGNFSIDSVENSLKLLSLLQKASENNHLSTIFADINQKSKVDNFIKSIPTLKSKLEDSNLTSEEWKILEKIN